MTANPTANPTAPTTARVRALDPAALLGLRVRVYRNLHNGLFSVQHRGRVLGHLPTLSLRGVAFTVQPAGRAKVLATGHKNVHAFVTGTVVALTARRLLGVAQYNPRRAATFTVRGSDQPVRSADFADISAAGIFLA